MKLALLTLGFVSGFGWLVVLISVVYGFIGWCLRPAERGWYRGVVVASWAVLAWGTALLIIMHER